MIKFFLLYGVLSYSSSQGDSFRPEKNSHRTHVELFPGAQQPQIEFACRFITAREPCPSVGSLSFFGHYSFTAAIVISLAILLHRSYQTLDRDLYISTGEGLVKSETPTEILAFGDRTLYFTHCRTSL